MNTSLTNKSTITQKIAAVLALLLGAMSVFAGGKVLLGIDTKNYTVLNGLVVYNVILGFFSIVVAYCIWKQKQKAKNSVFLVLTLHFLVLMYLTFMSKTVATESIKAMLFRVSVWLVIVLLSVIIPNYIKRKK